MRYHLLNKHFVLLLCFFPLPFLSAQNLSLGDIIFTGYNSDADPNNSAITDDFSFLLLKSVSSGEVISFTDRGWLAAGGFRVGEGTLTLSLQDNYSCGTEFRLFEENGTWKAVELSSGSAPSLTEEGDFSLSSSGDQIIVYASNTAPLVGTEDSFITALQFAGDWQSDATGSVESAQPAVFSNSPGNDFVVNPHADNGKYDCIVNSGDAAALRSNVYTAANWGFENSSTNRFDLSAACPFFCQGDCAPPVISNLTTNSLNNTFCIGDEVTITIDGNLNDATLWTFNNGDCNGAQEFTSTGNSVSFTATKTTSYHISGFGGCVLELNCTPITITVEGVEANAGPDQRLPQGTTSTSLQGNAPQGGTGTWSFIDEADGNGFIEDLNDPNSFFDGTAGQHYRLAWTIVNPDCVINSVDEVSISFLNPSNLQIGEVVFYGL